MQAIRQDHPRQTLPIPSRILYKSGFNIIENDTLCLTTCDLTNKLIVAPVVFLIGKCSMVHGRAIASSGMIGMKKNPFCTKRKSADNDLLQISGKCPGTNARISVIGLPIITIVHAKLHNENIRILGLDIVRHTLKRLTGSITGVRYIDDHNIALILKTEFAQAG